MKQFLILISIMVVFFDASAQWSNSSSENTPVSFSSSEEIMSKIEATSPGGVIYISYFSNESGNYDVFLQKFDKEGYTSWDEPLVVSDNDQQSWLSDYAMKCDGEENSIVTFSDVRNGNPEIYLYKIGPGGEFLWGEDGIACSTTSEPEYEPRLAVTSNNSAITTFIHPGAVSGDELVINGVDEDGDYLFGEDGLIYTPGEDTFYSDPYVVPALDGNFIVVYSKNTGDPMYPDRNLKAMKFDSEGNELWNSETTVSEAGGISGFSDLHVIPDSSGGVVVSWHDDRDNDTHAATFTQWIDSEGEPQLQSDGVGLAPTPAVNQYDPRAVVHNDGSIMVFWTQKNSNQSMAGYYGQRISTEGERLWGDDGQVFHELGDSFSYLWLARPHDEAGSVVFYTKFAEGSTSDETMHAAAIDEDGSFWWDEEEVKVSSVSSGITHPAAGPLNHDQYVLTWTDNRNGNDDIYAQNITTAGMLGVTDTEISEIPVEDVKLYPNPAHQSVKIRAENFNRITVRNSLGQVVTEFDNVSGKEVTFYPEQSGLYFVTFSGKGYSTTRKVTVFRK